MAPGGTPARTAGALSREVEARPPGAPRVTSTGAPLPPAPRNPGYTGMHRERRVPMEPYQFRMEAGLPMTSTAAAERVTAFLRLVYGWMAAGLAITALVAAFVASSPALLQVVVGNRIVFFGLIIAELGVVFFLSGRAHSLAPG